MGGGIAGLIALRRRRAPRRSVSSAGLVPNALLGAPIIEPDVIGAVADDGAVLHVRAYGDPDDEPIVLSHGWSCSCEYWYPQINALADRYRVITYDQRGHGHSEVGSRPLGPDVLADDLAAVLAAAVPAGRKVVVVGHSMGGMSVIAWAGRYPEQVDQYASAVLLASTATDSLVAETTVIPLPQYFPRVPVSVGRAVLGAPMPLVPSPVTSRAIKYITMSPTATPAEVAFCERIVASCHPRSRGGWGAALSTLDIREGLENLRVPTTVLVGSADRITPPVHARRLAKTLDEAGNLARFIELTGVGHMTTVEAADEVNAEIVRLRTLGCRQLS